MTRMAILYGLLAMFGWGLWTVLAKLATDSVPPALAMAISYATAVIVALTYVYTRRGGFVLDMDGMVLAAAAGVFAGIGAVAFYMGLETGRTSIITTVSALYFVVAAVIGILLLGEPVDLTDIGGIGFAVVAVVLLAR